MLQKEVQNIFSLSWELILRMTEQTDSMKLDDDPMDSFKIGYDYFKTQFGCVF